MEPEVKVEQARVAMRQLPELVIPFKRPVYEAVVKTFRALGA